MYTFPRYKMQHTKSYRQYTSNAAVVLGGPQFCPHKCYVTYSSQHIFSYAHPFIYHEQISVFTTAQVPVYFLTYK